MKKKKLFNLFAIILGVMIIFSFSKVEATEMISAFTGETLNTRSTMSAPKSNITQTILSTPIILQRIDSGYMYDGSNVIWKFVDKNNVNDMYYCLNKDQGFAYSEEAEYNYRAELNLEDLQKFATNTWNEAKYNKILWILDNVYIPDSSIDVYEDEGAIALLKKVGITTQRYNETYDLKVEDIVTAQRMAIWNITNGLDVITSISGIPDIDLQDYYTGDVLAYSRKSKIIQIYNYLVNNASADYTRGEPKVEVKADSNTVIKETDKSYVVGPYSLIGTNLDKVMSITETSKTHSYTLLNNQEKPVANNDFTKVLGKNFYLEIPKSEINGTTQIKLDLKINYDYRTFKFMTHSVNFLDTQPVVIVDSENRDTDIEIITQINLVNKTVQKSWDDNDNQDGVRPSNVQVQLYRGENTKVGNTITLNESNNWTYTWTNLLSGYEYKIYEINASGTKITEGQKLNSNYTARYEISDDLTTITNTHTPEKTSVSGTKTWVDNENQDGIRPESIVVKLLANGKEVERAEVRSPWTYTFTNLPKYSNGALIIYTVDEENVAGYTKTINGYNIINRYTPGVLEKTVTKIWDDGNNSDEIRPTQIQVQLYKNGVAQGSAITLNETNKWTYTWTNLPARESGKDITYTVQEVTVPNGYSVSYSEDTFTITNIHVPKDLAIQILKVDEEGNKITSSEATFEIAGKQQLTSKTSQGILDLNSQKLIGDNFEYTYTIKETLAPVGYNRIQEELDVKISGTTKFENGSYAVDSINITDENGNELDSQKISAEYDRELNKVVIKIVNTKIENAYSVKLLKVGEDGETTLENAWFKVNDGQAIQVSKDGNEIDTGILNSTNKLELTYTLEETIAPNGYVKIDEPKEVKIEATVELKDNSYQITALNLKEDIEGITVSEENNVITIKVKNEVEITGKYNVVLRKVDENGNILTGSKFNVNGTEYELVNGEVILLNDTDLTSIDDIILNYELKETQIPEGYEQMADKTICIKATVQKQDNNYKLIRVGLIDSEGNIITDEDISIKIESDSIVIVAKNIPIQKKFDLSLRKFITKVNDIEYSRQPMVDTSTILTTGTATYKHTKQPIPVQKGDIVTYTIRVYNEGELEGYVDKITDYLPDNLIPLLEGIDNIDTEKYKEEIEFNSNWLWQIIDGTNFVTTTITSKANSDTYSILTGLEEITDTKLNAYIESSTELDYIDVQIKCLVADTATSYEYLTNIAEITESQDINGVQGDGTDSEIRNVIYDNLSDYKNEEAISSTENSYVPGQEDDDDFEKLVVKEFDLALRKFITKVNEVSHSRVPVVDTSKLGTVVNGKIITTAAYNHSKEPVIVETGDIVTYTIRIYNEGTLAGYANEITDDIPEGLEFMQNSSVNVSYRWKMLDAEGNETKDVSKAVMIVTDYLSDADKNNIINSVSEVDGVKTLSYKDVEVQFKVIAKAEKQKDNLIINEAQISNDSDRDIDSIPNRNEKYDYDFGNNEDDIDYEPIKLQYFDLALRKFITKVNGVDYNNRYPEVKYNEDGSITYNHTKDPVLVTTNDVVVYTIRVYNEGEKAGYATELTDDLPEGLEFLPEDEINKQYNWKMVDKEGNVIDDITKANKFTTNYLKDKLIGALVVSEESKVLSYEDVKIAFKVTESNMSDRILVNTAQISNDSDDDVDSIPGNDVLTEDDIDREYVKVQYFDLVLKKWVTKSIVTYNGKTTTTETGFTEDTDEIAKVDLVASKMTKTTVKFAYNIKVTNEGELPGYAYEVKDYIPKGLKFVAADNKDWKELEDGSVVTDKLKDTLLNPGESATVEIVLTWKNSTTNLGLKTNYAEISNDSADDIDSTPDNYNKQEDDIDDAQVILSIKTAGTKTYIGLIFLTVAILAGGTFLIKKYVID